MLRLQPGRLRLISLRSFTTVAKTLILRRTSSINNTLRFNKTPLITNSFSTTTTGVPTSDQITSLTTNEFHKLSGEYLETLFDHLEYLGENHPMIDVEYSQGVLSLDLPPNGSYIINKQPPNKQIWLSSPVSGPDRFDPVDGHWVSLRNGLKLGDVLREEVSTALGESVTLEGLDD